MSHAGWGARWSAAVIPEESPDELDAERPMRPAALAATHGQHWSAIRMLPWLGPNVGAVQAVSEVIDGLAVDALPALMDATSLVDPTTLAPVDGRVNLAPLVKVLGDREKRILDGRKVLDPGGVARRRGDLSRARAPLTGPPPAGGFHRSPRPVIADGVTLTLAASLHESRTGAGCATDL